MQAGTTIQNYEAIRQVGVGGMGEVWLGRHKLIGREVAIKSLHPQLVQKESIRKRFKNEAATLARLQHPNVVALLDYHEDENGVYLIMEYVEGMPLDEYIEQKSGPIPEPLLSQLFAQVLAGVNYAHGKNIVHRDIKPSNFLITPDNTLKILDFGIAKLLDQSDNKLTKTGTAMGTVLYMSPEQVKGETVDHRSDIYSLGVTLFQMATGVCPYDKFTTEFYIYDQIVNHPLPEARTIYPGITDHIQFLIKRATEKDPNHRFQSSSDFLDALGEVKAPSSGSSGKSSVPPPPPVESSGSGSGSKTRSVPPPPPVESSGSGSKTRSVPPPPPGNQSKEPPLGKDQEAGEDEPASKGPKVPASKQPSEKQEKSSTKPSTKDGSEGSDLHANRTAPQTTDQPSSEQPHSEQPHSDQPQSEQSQSEQKGSGTPETGSPGSGQSQADQPDKPKKKRRLLLIILAILILAGGGTTIALLAGGKSEPEKLFVIASNLFVRLEPFTEAEKDGKLPFGTEIEVVGRPNDEWVEIKRDGKKGYLANKYLRQRDKFYKLNYIFTNSEGKLLLDGSYHKLALEAHFTKNGYRVDMPGPDYQRIYGEEKSDRDIWQVNALSPGTMNTVIPEVKLEKANWAGNETRNSVAIVNNKADPDKRNLVAFNHTKNGNNEIGALDISHLPGHFIAPVSKRNLDFIADPSDNMVITKEMKYGKEGILLAKSPVGYSGKLVLWTNGQLKIYPLLYYNYAP